MTFPRLATLLALPVLAAGCATPRDRSYTMLRVTDQRGALVAEWIAKGPVRRVEKGFAITAVERLSAPPQPVRSTYPHGWHTTVTGPHILRWACGEPYWLYALENE